MYDIKIYEINVYIKMYVYFFRKQKRNILLNSIHWIFQYFEQQIFFKSSKFKHVILSCKYNVNKND